MSSSSVHLPKDIGIRGGSLTASRVHREHRGLTYEMFSRESDPSSCLERTMVVFLYSSAAISAISGIVHAIEPSELIRNIAIVSGGADGFLLTVIGVVKLFDKILGVNLYLLMN